MRKQTTSVSQENIVELSVIRRERHIASSPYGPVKAGLTTLQGTSRDQALTELLNSLERSSRPELQVLHGIRYLSHRYSGSACRALRHSDRRGWY